MNPPIDRQVLLWLLAAIALVTGPHLANIPIFLFGYFSLLLIWRTIVVWYPALLPNQAVLLGLIALGIGLLYIGHQGVLGRDAGTAVFVVALGLKLMEVNTSRDIYLLIYLAFFVAVTQFLFSQSIFMSLYILSIVALLIATMISYTADRALNALAPVKLAGVMMMQAVPLMVVLFIFFPRLADNSRFSLPFLDAKQSVTGLADTLDLGSIGELTRSSQIAFRATFDGDLPPAGERYWRGPVFWRSKDGRRWVQPHEYSEPEHEITFSGEVYHYTVILEAHHKKWLFGLEMVSAMPAEAKRTAEYQTLNPKRVMQRKSYRMSSYTHYNTGPISQRERSMALQSALSPTQRMVQLVTRWRKQSESDEAVARSAMRYFHDQPFFYTLKPPPLGGRPIDQFLFETRRGFCEHYATAFVTLMRTAKIPARVVAGYMGGEYNPLGNFIEVRQLDAHAWAEVWLAGKGWVRFDPTTAVAPERIEEGVIVENESETGIVSYRISGELSDLSQVVRQLRYGWAVADHKWHQWVINYTSERQSRLFSQLGIRNIAEMVLWLLGSLGILLALIVLALFYRRPQKADQVVRLYHRFCDKLAGVQLQRGASEGATTFGKRASEQRPESALAIRQITSLYVKIRYCRTSEQGDLRQLKRLVRQFKA